MDIPTITPERIRQLLLAAYLQMLDLVTGWRDFPREELYLAAHDTELNLLDRLRSRSLRQVFPGMQRRSAGYFTLEDRWQPWTWAVPTHPGDGWADTGGWRADAMSLDRVSPMPGGQDGGGLQESVALVAPPPNQFVNGMWNPAPAPPRSLGLVYALPSWNLYPPPLHSGCPLFDLYCLQRNLPEWDAIRALRADLGLPPSHCLPPDDRKTPERVFHFIERGHMPPRFDAHLRTLTPTLEIPFTDKSDDQVFSLLVGHGARGTVVMPFTTWCVEEDNTPRGFLVPPPGLRPLLNLPGLLGQLWDIPVLLVDSPVLAHALNQVMPEVFPEGPRPVATSWYQHGSFDLDSTDFSPLAGRQVVYLFCSLRDNFYKFDVMHEPVFDKLRKVGAEVFAMDCRSTVDRSTSPPNVDFPEGRPAWVPVPERETILILPPGTAEAPPEPEDDGPEIYSLGTLADAEIPEPAMLLRPVLLESTFNLLCSVGGLGKTYLALCGAASMASGHPLLGPWTPERPVDVLYLDGELDSWHMRRRLAQVVKLMPEGCGEKVARRIGLVSHEDEKNERIDLGTEEGQEIVEKAIRKRQKETGRKVELLIVDNLESFIATSTSEPAIKALARWAKKLNRQGICVLLLHHPNKDGVMRGSGVLHGLLDQSFELEEEETAVAGGGRALVLKPGKNRHIPPSEAAPLHLRLRIGGDNPGIECWREGEESRETLGQDDKVRRVCEAHPEMTDAEMADEVNMNVNTFKAAKRRLGLTGKGGKGRAKGGRRRGKSGGDSAGGN